MTDLAALLRLNLAVFGERDADRRAALIAENFTDDVQFTDEDGTVIGRDAVDEKVRSVLEGVPDEFAFEADGPVYLDGGTGALAWALGPKGAPVVRGLDIVTERDGRIASVRTILAAG